ncbi:hypothetical protein AN958_03991 [Leucoagaricus sp. SymC.cos]|nr:hypothetical protein AN958_03991 [Leucoagaricus sp. SymC.cos]
MVPSLRLGTLALSLARAFARAAPVQENEEMVTPNLTFLEKRAITPLTTAQVASYRPYTPCAAVPTCGQSSLLAWNYGVSLPLITDADLFPIPLWPDLFPGLSLDVQTHNGFGNAQALSAAPVLSAVKTTMSRFGASQVAVVGQSLGQGGNKPFVNYVNSQFPGAVARIDNKHDTLCGNFNDHGGPYDGVAVGYT